MGRVSNKRGGGVSESDMCVAFKGTVNYNAIYFTDREKFYIIN